MEGARCLTCRPPLEKSWICHCSVRMSSHLSWVLSSSILLSFLVLGLNHLLYCQVPLTVLLRSCHSVWSILLALVLCYNVLLYILLLSPVTCHDDPPWPWTGHHTSPIVSCQLSSIAETMYHVEDGGQKVFAIAVLWYSLCLIFSHYAYYSWHFMFLCNWLVKILNKFYLKVS